MRLAENELSSYTYRNWVVRSKNLDYFDFAEHCHLSQKDTNAHYASILSKLKKCSNMKVIEASQNASSIFKVGSSVRYSRKAEKASV